MMHTEMGRIDFPPVAIITEWGCFNQKHWVQIWDQQLELGTKGL